MEMAPASGTVTMQLDHAAHDRTAVTDGPPAQTDRVGSRLAQSTAGDGSPGSGHGADVLGLCLAVLAALLLGTGLLSARRRVRPPRPFLPTRPPSAATGRDRDPPDRLRLCVIRC